MSEVFLRSSSFLDYLESCWPSFSSSFGPFRSCKFVVKDGYSTMVSCITELLPEFCSENALYDVIYASLMSHHNTHGCGTATMTAMFYFWHRELMKLCCEGIDIEDVISELETSLETAIGSLDSLVISLKNIVLQADEDLVSFTNLKKNGTLCEAPSDQQHYCSSSASITNFLRNNGHIADDERDIHSGRHGFYIENDCIWSTSCLSNDYVRNLNKITQLVLGLGHGNNLLSDLLAKAWNVQIEQKKMMNFSSVESLKFELSQVTTLTIKSASTNSRVIDGLLLKVNQEAFEILSRCVGRNMRALLINGNVTQSFIHKGVNLPFESDKFATVISNIQKNSSKELWTRNALDVLKKLTIDVLLISGGIDEDFFLNLCMEEISAISYINAKNLDALANASGASVACYINDCDELNVMVGISVSIASDCHVLKQASSEHYVVLHTPEVFQTAVICHPLTDYLNCLEHNFWHVAHRLSKATISDKLLPGKGATEEYAANSLHTMSSINTSHWAASVIANGLMYYSQTVKRKLACDGACIAAELNVTPLSSKTNELTLDDYSSKTESWRAALSLACLVAKTDMIILGNFDGKRYQNKMEGII